MKYILLTISALFLVGCIDGSSASDCRKRGWAGVISSQVSQYCSNGEIVGEKFVTDDGTRSVYGTSNQPQYRYISFEEEEKSGL